MSSIWIEKTEKPQFEGLQGSVKTDVLIIGGGIAGIMCAYSLKNAGVDCMLVEADEICGGTTGNTTAKVTLQHGLIYSKIIKEYGTERARLYLDAQATACRRLGELADLFPCDYTKRDAYVYSLTDRDKIEKELSAYQKLGQRADHVDEISLPFKVAGAVRIKNQAEINPLKLLYSMAKELPVYERTKVKELMRGRAITDRGEIRCSKIIIATHFPILNKHGGYFLKMYQHRSYVLALNGAPCVDGMYVDESGKGLSFRNYGDLLLLGGGAHRTGKNGGCWQELESFAGEHYDGARIEARWATQDCMTLDGIPYIGQYSRRTPDLYVATGFNKWGMTSSVVASMILTDLILDKKCDYVPVFSPSRSILHPQLAVNALESVVGLLTPTAPRCPHLGCALKYNKQERSWDCPCHGSRFTEEGKLINNPATDDKRM